MELTSKSSFPVLQTLSVCVLELPTQVSGKLTLPGTCICGTQQTTRWSKKTLMPFGFP